MAIGPHASPVVQGLPSLHGLWLIVDPHSPVAGLQASSVQKFPSLHEVGVPVQDPPEQTSPVVQRLPS